MPTLFTRILHGDIPCYKVAEDAKFFAFLDINPKAEGHTLVVPKQEIDYIFDLDDLTLGEMVCFAKRVAKAIGEAFPCEKVAMSVLGLEVPHAHIHLIPLKSEETFYQKGSLSLSPEEFRACATKIAAALG